GIGYNPPREGGIERRYYPYGGISLNGLWRRTTLLVEARQAVTGAYGLGGSQISDIGTVTATFPLSRWVDLSVLGNVTSGRERTNGQPEYVSEDGTVNLNWRIFRFAGIGLGYGYRRYDPDNGVATHAHQA